MKKKVKKENKPIELTNNSVKELKKSIKFEHIIAGKYWDIVISYDKKAQYTFNGENILGITWTHRPVMFIHYEKNDSAIPFTHLIIHELTHAYFNHAYINMSVHDDPSEYVAQFNGNFLLNIYHDMIEINNKAVDLISEIEKKVKKNGKLKEKTIKKRKK